MLVEGEARPELVRLSMRVATRATSNGNCIMATNRQRVLVVQAWFVSSSSVASEGFRLSGADLIWYSQIYFAQRYTLWT